MASEHQNDQMSGVQGFEDTSLEASNQASPLPLDGAAGPHPNIEHTQSGPGRKSRACGECRRLKLKCEIPLGGRVCRNCQRRRVECTQKSRTRFSSLVASTPFEAAITEHFEQKMHAVTADIQDIKQTLDRLCRQPQGEPMTNSQPTAYNVQVHTTPQSHADSGMYSTRETNTQMAMTRENSVERESSGAEIAPGSAVTVEEPMGHLYEVTRLRNIRSNKAQEAREDTDDSREFTDFITRGLVSEEEALELYNIFHTSLNHYLWIGLEETHPNFSSVRRKSELLAATILTVTALHLPHRSETFDKCYAEFLRLTSSSMFSRYHSVDDVRGLCIAAFWLSEVSWKLSGHAIRIAIELNMHQSFFKALEGNKEHFLRARLWYMLYVCDHHFSVAYGRPPILSETLQIREHELFLKCPFSNTIDYRILSQVSLMQLLTRISDRFTGRSISQHDPSGALLSNEDFVDMRRFNLEIDQWRLKWNPLQKQHEFIGTFPEKGIILYSYFAKLQLNALAVRGIPISFPTPYGRNLLTTERKEFANMAISAAASILTFVLEEEDMRRALVGTPLYVHTMIAFASVFLMKLATRWNKVIGLNLEVSYISDLLERMIVLLKESVASERHLIYHIAAGLEKMLQKSRNSSMEAHRVDGVSQDRPVERWTQINPVNQYQSDVNAARGVMTGPHEEFPSHSTEQWQQYNGGNGQAVQLNSDEFNNPMSIMNDGWIHEAFGYSEPATDVYNLLTSQFSY